VALSASTSADDFLLMLLLEEEVDAALPSSLPFTHDTATVDLQRKQYLVTPIHSLNHALSPTKSSESSPMYQAVCRGLYRGEASSTWSTCRTAPTGPGPSCHPRSWSRHRRHPQAAAVAAGEGLFAAVVVSLDVLVGVSLSLLLLQPLPRPPVKI
jgi:hypothetical protein